MSRLTTFISVFLILLFAKSVQARTQVNALITLKPTESVLIEAPQAGRDIMLELIDARDQRLIKQVSFPWHKGLPEFLYVGESDCLECVVRVVGLSGADQESSSADLIKIESSHTDFWQRMNQAGMLAFESQNLRDKAKQAILQRLVEALIFARQVAPSQKLRLHINTLLAETFLQQNSVEDQTRVLESVLAATSNGDDKLYRIHALYELAAYEKDQDKLASLFSEGIELSRLIGSERLEATGFNYQAVSFIRAGKFQAAFDLLHQSKAAFEKGQYWRDLMYPIHNLSWGHQRAGNFPKSLEFAVEQQLLAERFGIDDHEIMGLYNMAMAYGQLSQLARAEQLLDQAIQKFDQRSIDSALSSVMGGYLLEERAQRLLEQGAFSHAADVAEQSKLYFERTGYPARVADALYLEGQIDFALGRTKKAKEKILQVVKYDRDNKRDQVLGNHLLRLAEIEFELGNTLEAASYQYQGMVKLRGSEDIRQLLLSVLQCAQLIWVLGDAEQAELLLDDISLELDEYGLLIDKARYNFISSKVFNTRGQVDKAIMHAQLAQSLIESALDEILREDLKRYFVDIHRSIVDFHVELLATNYRDDPYQSLMVAERMRAQTIKSRLRLNKHQLKIERAQLKQRDSLLRQIHQQAARWHSTPSDSEKILSLTRNLGRQLYKLESSHLDLSQKASINEPQETATKLRALGEHEIAAVYFLGTNKSWLWMITRGRVELVELPSSEIIQSTVTQFRNTIDRPPSTRADQDAWSQRDAIQDLRKILIEPLLEKMQKTQYRQVSVVPDGSLHLIPFAPLLGLANDSSSSQKAILTIDISVSAPANKKAQKVDYQRVLVVADTNDADLAYTAEEANAIESVFHDQATLLTEYSATKSEFYRALESQYDVLHFATHGIVNANEPLLLGLAFAPDETGYLLLAPEIRNLGLNGELVVLSACESSVGKIFSGEGALSLSRAFMEAGASNVVGSLWPVEDQASGKFMLLFYKALKELKKKPAQALLYAQTELSRSEGGRWRDPYYWAGFQLYRTVQ